MNVFDASVSRASTVYANCFVDRDRERGGHTHTGTHTDTERRDL